MRGGMRSVVHCRSVRSKLELSGLRLPRRDDKPPSLARLRARNTDRGLGAMRYEELVFGVSGGGVSTARRTVPSECTIPMLRGLGYVGTSCPVWSFKIRRPRLPAVQLMLLRHKTIHPYP